MKRADIEVGKDYASTSGRDILGSRAWHTVYRVRPVTNTRMAERGWYTTGRDLVEKDEKGAALIRLLEDMKANPNAFSPDQRRKASGQYESLKSKLYREAIEKTPMVQFYESSSSTDVLCNLVDRDGNVRVNDAGVAVLTLVPTRNIRMLWAEYATKQAEYESVRKMRMEEAERARDERDAMRAKVRKMLDERGIEGVFLGPYTRSFDISFEKAIDIIGNLPVLETQEV